MKTTICDGRKKQIFVPSAKILTKIVGTKSYDKAVLY